MEENSSIKNWFGKFIRGKVFPIIFFILSLGLIVYLSSRLGILTEAFIGVNPQLYLFIIMFLYFGYMVIYFNINSQDKKTRKLFNICSIILCFFPSMIAFFLLYDFVHMIFHLHNNQLYLIPLSLSLMITIYGFIHARNLKIKEYKVPIEGENPKENIKIVLLSDIHVGPYVTLKQLHKIVETVNKLHADIILMVGDTFDQDAFYRCNLEAVKKELQSLCPKDSIYAVLGNHDPASNCEDIRTFFNKANIKLLIDEYTKTEDFWIIGRDDILGNPNRKSLHGLIMEAKATKPLIVLDHNPVGIDDAIAEDVDLVLCGHTHKGQFFPATFFTKLAYGERGFYGYHKTNRTQSIVSAGAGYFQLPMRLGTNSEIVLLNITIQQNINQR